MRALVYTAPHRVVPADLPEPEPAAGQVVVRVAACGLCGSDMHAYHGADPRRVPPLVLGHEATGDVLSGPLAGARVAINPLMTCGRCPACRGGRPHLCPARELLGMRLPGAFAERVAVDARNLSVLPDHLGDRDAALAEPLACAVHAARLGIGHLGGPPVRALVIGGGAIGLLSALVLADRGTAVTLSETAPGRRETAGALGLATVDPQANAPDPAPLIIDAVGSGRTRAAASALAEPGGAIVHVGLQDNGPGLDTRRLTLQEIAFLGLYCYAPEDFAEALRLLAEGRISGAGWVEERPLAEGAGAFAAVDAGTAAPKILLIP
ncbi:MAG: alcohol dehydrogenase catalytic domain-containing protein [Paracoccaceae bacterium]